MKLGYRPPRGAQAFVEYAQGLQGLYDFIEVPASSLMELKPAIAEARAMGYALSLHARYVDLYPGAVEPKVRQASLEVLREDLHHTAELGAFLLNLHAGNLAWTDYPDPLLSPEHAHLRQVEALQRQTYLQRSKEVLAVLAEEARSLSVTLALENLPAPQEVPRTPQEMAYFSDLELVFCLDIGHARIAGFSPEAFLQLLGGRVQHLHLHGNDTRYDLHLLPDLQEVLPLRDFRGSLVVELPPRNLEEYLRAHQVLAQAGFIQQAIGGKP